MKELFINVAFMSTFNLKRFPGNHLPITYLQLTLKVNDATYILVYAYVIVDIH